MGKAADPLLPGVCFAGWGRRPPLLRTTALQAVAALAFVAPAAAQPAATARPQGGTVVGGTASIAQTTAQTTVTQATQRAAIDWRSFDVGSGHTVQYQQPNASAVILNRVTGPDPSQIAGRIQANGQVIITNQSGVVFHQGAQVDAAGLVVSAAGITNRNFMAGKMVFDQAPKPDAAVTNAGTITVKETGLAALVAPRVANSGVINARMGRVALAGAETHTVDLYGDGLLAIDVTSQVRQAPRGPDGKPVTALVTNTGTVIAQGGSVQITAAAADGIVQNLVQAGGSIRADAAGGRQGAIVIAGVGGGVRIEGQVGANGGGTVTATSTGTVTVASGARVTANGRAGGGTINIGDRASGGATVEAGARLAANGSGTGTGGRVNVLSAGTTRMAGRIAARGGAQGGDGGNVEVSGKRLQFSGAIDASAPAGKVGSVLFDPGSTAISDHGAAAYPDVDTVLDPASFAAVSGTLSVNATNNLYVLTGFSRSSGSSTNLTAGNLLYVDAGVTINVSSFLVLSAGAPGINLQGSVSTPSSILQLNTSGAVTQGPGSIVTANTLTGSVGSLALTNSVNRINQVGYDPGYGTTGQLAASTGDISVTSAVPLSIQSAYYAAGTVVPNGRAITFTADSLPFVVTSGTVVASAPGGSITLAPLTAGKPIEVVSSNPTQGSLSFTPSQLSLLRTATLGLGNAAAGPISLANNDAATNYTMLGFSTLRLRSAGDITQSTAANAGITVGTLDASGANINLSNGYNAIPVVTNLTGSGNVALEGGASLTVNGPITAGGSVNLSTSGTVNTGVATMTLNANITAGTTVRLDTSNGTDLNSSGTLVQAAGASITGTTLIGSAQAATLPGANSIAVGDYTTAGAFTFNGATGIQLAGQLNVGGTATLTTPGAITQTGALSASTLTGNAGSVDLSGSGNVVGQLGAFTVGTGDFNLTTGLNDGVSFSVVGAVTTHNVVPTTSGNGAIRLTADSITFGTGGSLTASTGPGESSGAIVFAPLTPGTPVEIVATAAEQSTTALSLTQADLNKLSANIIYLGSSGIYSAGNVTLGAAGDAINLSGITTLSVSGTGTISQGAGASVTVPNLYVSGGNTTLTGPNNVGALGYITAGTFAFTNAGSFSVIGPVVASGDVQLRASAAASNITFRDPFGISAGLTAPNATLGAGTGGVTFNTPGTFAVSGLNLNTTGPVAQTGTGGLQAASVFGSAGSLALTSASNQIGALAGLAVTGNAAITSSTGFAAAGTNSAASATLIAPSFQVSGTLSVAGTVAVTTTGLFAAPGNLVAGTLTGSASSANLTGGSNVGTLGSFTATSGAFTLRDIGQLTVSGPVSSTSAVNLSSTGPLTLSGGISAPTVALTASNNISFPGTITQTAGTVAGVTTLTAASGISQTGGAFTGAGLSGSAGGAVSLPGANAVTSLGPFSSTGNFLLADGTTALSIAGALNAGANTVTLSAGSITAALASPITAGTLTGSTTGAALFSNSVNAVGRLGPFTTGGDFALNDGGGTALQVVGAVNAGANQVNLVARGITQTAAGAITAGTLSGSSSAGYDLTTATNAISGLGPLGSTGGAFALNDGTTALAVVSTVTVPGNTVRLTAGTITEAALGVVSAATLTGSSSGSTALTSGGNMVANLGPFTSTGAFSFADAAGLTVVGALNAGGNAVTLAAPSLTQTALGVITAGTLAGTVSGGTTLTAAANAVTNLGAFTATGGFALNDSVGLTFTGALNAGTNGVALTAPSLSQGPSGIIAAGTLTGTVTGATNLGTAANAVGAIGGFSSTGGNFTLADTVPLAITGALNAGTNTVTLNASSLTQAAAGVITAGTLGGTVPGATTLTAAANAVTNLGAFSSGGFALTDSTGLTLTGALNAGTNSVTLNAPTLTQAGAGTIVAGTLGGAIAGAATLTNGGNAIAGLGPFGATGLTLTDSVGVQLRGAVNLGTGTFNLTAPGVSQTAAGVLTAGTFRGSFSGSVALGTAANVVGTLGNVSAVTGVAFNAAGALNVLGPVIDGVSVALSSAGTLTVAGSVSAPRVSLTSTGGALAFSGGTVSAPTELDLSAATPVTQPGGGGITTTLLTVAGPSATLTSGSNSIATLGTVTTTGAFSLTDGRSLTVTGPVTAGSAQINVTGDLTLVGTVTAPTVTLSASGNVSQSAGAITATTVGGSAGGAFTLGSATNRYDQVGPVTAGTRVVLTDATGLTVTGAIDPPDVTMNVTGDLSIARPINAGTLTLNVSGAVTETASGAVTAGTLAGVVGSANLNTAVTVDTLGGLSATGALSLADGKGLTVAGTVQGSSVSLSSLYNMVVTGDVTGGTVALRVATTASVATPPTLAQTGGTVTGTASVSVVSAGDILQSGGTIVTPSLTGSAGGSANFGSTGNAVGTVGFTSSTGFSLNNTPGLVASGITDATSISLFASGPLSIAGAGLSTAGPISLSTNGTLTQSGPIQGATLSGFAGTSVTLGNAGNYFATLAGLSSNGPIVLTDSVGLTLTGALNAGNNTVTLSAPTLTQTAAGTVTAGALTGNFGGAVTLAAANNTIDSVGPISATGLSLTDSVGPFIVGAINLGAGTLSINAPSIAELSNSVITAGSFTGVLPNGILATGANNVGTLGSVTTNANLNFNNVGPLTVSGPVTAGTSLALTSGGTLTLNGTVRAPRVSLTSTGGSLAFNGTLSAATELDLAAATPITQPGGGITTAFLAVAAPSATLTGTGNAVGALGTVSTTGAFSLNNGVSLNVVGPVTAGSVLLTTAGDLMLPGSIMAGTVTLNASGNVTQSAGTVTLPAGSITATTLAGNAGGAFTLGSATNRFAQVGPVIASSSVVLTDAASLTVTGPIDPPNVTMNVTGDLAIASSIAAGTLTLNVSGAVTESGTGTISAATLAGTVGSAQFDRGSVTTLAGLVASGGAFSLNNGQALTVSGPVSSPTSIALTTAGVLTLSGNVTAPTVTLTANSVAPTYPYYTTLTGNIVQTGGTVAGATVLTAGGAISQTGGSFKGGSLSGSAGGAVSLGQANAVATLGAFSSGGSFTLANGSTPLSIAGALNAGSNTVTLSGSSVSQTASGVITAGTFGGSFTGAANLGTAANAVGTLGNVASAGGFAFNAAGALNVAGTVTDTASVALSGVGTVTLSGSVSAPRVSLTSSGGGLAFSAGTLSAPTELDLVSALPITEPGGGITTGLLTVAAPSAMLTGTNNSIAALGSVAVPGGFSLTDGRSLVVSGLVNASASFNVTGDLTLTGTLNAPTLTLNASGNVTQPSGTITSAALSGTAGGAFTLGATTNMFDQAGPISAGTFVLTDARGLSLAGAVTAPGGATFNVTGDLGIGAPISSNAVTLNVSGAVTEGAAGQVAAGTLSGSVGSAVLDRASVAALGAFTSGGALSLTDSVPLSVSGPVTASVATLGTTGGMTLTGDVTGSRTVSLGAIGAITQGGGRITAPELAVTAGSASLGSTGNAVSSVTSNSGGGFKLVTAGPLVSNVSDQASVSLNVTGALTLAGGSAPATNLVASGAITQTGAITAATLTGSGASVTLGAANRLTNLGGFVSLGDLLLSTPDSPTVTGAVSAGTGRTLTLSTGGLAFKGGSLSAPGGTVALAPYAAGAAFTLGQAVSGATLGAVTAGTLQVGTAGSGDLTIASGFDLSSVGSLALVSGGTISQAAGATITAPRLTANGAVVRLDQANVVGTLGNSAATGAFTFVDAAALTVAGTVGAGSGTLGVSGAGITLGTTTLAATLSGPAVALNAGAGALTQPNGSIAAGTLSGAAGSVALGGKNQVGVLGPFASPGAFAFNDGAALTLGGDVSGTAVSLAAPSISRTAGTLTAGTLSLNVGGDASLTTAVSSLGSTTVNGTLRLVNGGAVSLAGPVSAGTLDVTAATVNLDGQVTAGTLRLATGSVMQRAGSLQVGTVTGASTGDVVLGVSGTAAVSSVVDLSALRSLTLVSTVPLTASGTMSAPNMTLKGTGGVMLPGTTLVADQVVVEALNALGTTVAVPGRFATLAASGVGGAANITQTGTSVVRGYSGAATQVQLTVHGGAISLQNLVAPAAAVVTSMDGGTVAGTVNLGSLFVNDTGGSASLAGAVGGQIGSAAAQAAGITRFDTAYTLNGCAIASVSCGQVVQMTQTIQTIQTVVTEPNEPVVRIVVPTTVRPDIAAVQSLLRTDLFTVDLITLDIVRSPTDPEFTLPNISERDY